MLKRSRSASPYRRKLHTRMIMEGLTKIGHLMWKLKNKISKSQRGEERRLASLN